MTPMKKEMASAGHNNPFSGALARRASTPARRAPAARPPRLPAVRLDAYRACSGVVVCVGTDRVRGVAALRRSPGRGGSRAVALFFCRAAAVVSTGRQDGGRGVRARRHAAAAFALGVGRPRARRRAASWRPGRGRLERGREVGGRGCGCVAYV